MRDESVALVISDVIDAIQLVLLIVMWKCWCKGKNGTEIVVLN